MGLYRLEGPVSPADSTSRLVLETNDAGVPTKAIDLGQVGELTDEEFGFWSGTFKFESVNKSDKDNVYGLGFEDLGPATAASTDVPPGPDSGEGVTQLGPQVSPAAPVATPEQEAAASKDSKKQ